jgi:Xaa-Pro aminopeptidase
MNKFENLRRIWQKEGEAYLLFKPEALKLNDLRYLTGFNGSTGIFLQTKEKNILFVDGRYFEKVKTQKNENLEIILLDINFKKIIRDIFKKEKIKKIVIEPYQSFAFIKKLEKILKNVKIIVSKKEITSQLRIRKDEKEIEILKKAQRIADEIFEEILNFIKPEKHKEKEVAFKIYELAVKKYGCEDLSFEPIIASGNSSSIPHYRSENKIIKNNSPLLIDFGVIYQGYVSDMTRTLWVGNKVDIEFKKIYKFVLEAQEIAIEKCKFEKPIKAKEVDKAVRDYFKKYGYEKYFLHSTGHGIGMDIHEAPTLSIYSKDILRGNEVVTIEPGIYLEGRFGIRIEDTVITGRGENITFSSKDLIRL